MSEDIETTIYTEDEVRVHVSKWDDGGVWMRLSARHGSMSTALTRKEAEQILAGLQEILSNEVTA